MGQETQSWLSLHVPQKPEEQISLGRWALYSWAFKIDITYV